MKEKIKIKNGQKIKVKLKEVIYSHKRSAIPQA